MGFSSIENLLMESVKFFANELLKLRESLEHFVKFHFECGGLIHLLLEGDNCSLYIVALSDNNTLGHGHLLLWRGTLKTTKTWRIITEKVLIISFLVVEVLLLWGLTCVLVELMLIIVAELLLVPSAIIESIVVKVVLVPSATWATGTELATLTWILMHLIISEVIWALVEVVVVSLLISLEPSSILVLHLGLLSVAWAGVVELLTLIHTKVVLMVLPDTLISKAIRSVCEIIVSRLMLAHWL